MKPARHREPDLDEFEDLDFELIAVEEVPDPEGVRWSRILALLIQAGQEDE